MARRTINDAVFGWYAANGQFLTARRGDTVDIPEGDDLTRGDTFGAFTANVDDEVLPVGGLLTLEGERTLPELDLDWSSEVANHYIDAATINEVKADITALGSEEARVQAARMLLGAESSRPKSRQRMIKALNEFIEGTVEIDEPADEVGDTEPASLDEFVSTNTIDTVLEEAGTDPEKAKALRLAEESRGEKARKSLLEALLKIEQ